MARSDVHAPSNFKASDYRYAFAFAFAHTVDGWPIPAFNIETMIAHLPRRARIPMENGDSRGSNYCDVCGACFVYGEAWEHIPSGQIIHLGHTCAQKYELHADDPAYERALAGHRAKVIRRLERLRKIAAARRFLTDAGAELRRALRERHHITRDLVAKLLQWGSLTEGQVKLALKLAREAAERRANPEPEWAEVPQGLGRITVRGRVLHTKAQPSLYRYNSDDWKMLVAATLPDGRVVKLWGTIPTAMLDLVEKALGGCPEGGLLAALKGRQVAFKAKVERSRNDPKFGVFSRPTSPELVAA